MKKTLIALSLIAATSSVSAVELYNQDGNSVALSGRAEATLKHDDSTSDASKIRLGFQGKTQITDTVYGVGYYEGEFNANGYAETRYSYAGIGSQYGEVGYGKNDGALGMISDVTDVLSSTGNYAGGAKTAAGDRLDNAVYYKGQWGNILVKANYAFEEQNEAGTVERRQGASIGGVYKNNGLTLGAGYSKQNDNDQIIASAGYNFGSVYLAALVNTGEINLAEGYTIDGMGYDLTGQYYMGKAVYSLTYGYSEITSKEGLALDGSKLGAEAAYFFQPNFRGYVSYTVDLSDDLVSQALSYDNLAQLGLRYDF